MNTSEMIKTLENQGYKVRKPINREWWIEFRTDGATQVYDEFNKAVVSTGQNTIEVVHVVEKKMRKRRKRKNETEQKTEMGPA